MLSTANKVKDDSLPSRVVDCLGSNLHGKLIAVWGITSDTDENGEPTLIEALLKAGADVALHDPEATEGFRLSHDDHVEWLSNKWDAVQNADALVVASVREEYVNIDVGTLRWHLKEPLVLDVPNCMSRNELLDAQFQHIGVSDDRDPMNEAPKVLDELDRYIKDVK